LILHRKKNRPESIHTTNEQFAQTSRYFSERREKKIASPAHRQLESSDLPFLSSSFLQHPPTHLPQTPSSLTHIKANSPRMSLLSQTLRRSTLQLHLLPSRSALVALSPRLPSSHHSRFYATPSSPSPSTSTSTPSAASSPPPNTPISLQGKGVQEELKHENAKLFSKQDTLSYRDLLLIFSETITKAVSVHLLSFLPNKRNPKGLKEMGGRRELEEEGRRRG